MNKLKSISWAVGVFFLAGFFATNYTLNHFYVNGGYMLDSGWFAYLSANSVNWPASNPPSIGGTYFSTHFSPAFYIYTAIYKLLSNIGFIKIDIIWFSITQGIWFALAAASTFVLLTNNSKPSAAKRFWIFTASLTVVFNGVFLASIGFPHFEIAIPALLVTFFAFHIKGYTKTAILFLCLGLLMREDAGLHYFGLFFLLASYFFFFSKKTGVKEIKFYSRLAISCFVYSLLAIAIQKIYFSTGDNALARVYLGEPAFAHISEDFIKERLKFIADNRLYIFIPVFLTIIISIYKKSWGLLIGVGAVFPWIIFSLLGISFQAGTLTSYYAFPVAIAFFWPAIAYAIFLYPRENYAIRSGHISITDVSIIAFSSVLFYIGSAGNHDNSPWRSFWPEWFGKINSTHESLDEFIKSNRKIKFIMDDSVASLLSSTAKPSEWKYQLGFSKDEFNTADAILFQPGGWLTGTVKEMASNYGYRQLCHLPHTNFAVLSRLTSLSNCESPKVIEKNRINTTAEFFDYIPGWSHKEIMGRWTVGSEVALPVIEGASYNMLCFKGHGFLPNQSSRIFVKVYSYGALLGEFQYDRSSPDGERCISAPSRNLTETPGALKSMKIVGHSSPASHGISADDRLLGVFVEEIYLKKTN
jgi:hypothetical protein